KKARRKYIAKGDFRAGLVNAFIIVDHAMNSELILRCVCSSDQAMELPDLNWGGLRTCRVFCDL
ncbi:MAG: hypothetical protein MI799_03485, partial [Desulfobacterales bacterium]|nr:hypothetical protein [Desulfobacterales bacterium]